MRTLRLLTPARSSDALPDPRCRRRLKAPRRPYARAAAASMAAPGPVCAPCELRRDTRWGRGSTALLCRSCKGQHHWARISLRNRRKLYCAECYIVCLPRELLPVHPIVRSVLDVVLLRAVRQLAGCRRPADVVCRLQLVPHVTMPFELLIVLDTKHTHATNRTSLQAKVLCPTTTVLEYPSLASIDCTGTVLLYPSNTAVLPYHHRCRCMRCQTEHAGMLHGVRLMQHAVCRIDHAGLRTAAGAGRAGRRYTHSDQTCGRARGHMALGSDDGG
jgi:hypothetical protein